jgi:hypothetical protein
MKKTVLWGSLLICMGLVLAACGSGGQNIQAYKIKIERAGEIVVGQAQGCLSQIRAYWAVAEYARVSNMDFATAAREMGGGQTAENLQMMREAKIQIDQLLEGMSEPPEPFEEAFARLEDLYTAYMRIHDFALKPPADMQDLNEQITEMQSGLFQKKTDFDDSLLGISLR